MKYITLLLAGCTLFAAIDSNAQAKKKPVAKKPATAASKTKTTGATAQKWSKTDFDLEYKFISRGTGLVNPKPGDMVEVHVIQKIDDSVMMDSYAKGGGKPVSFVLQEPSAKGDASDGIMMMKTGDSAVFKIRLDTLAQRAGQPMPPFAAKNAYISWAIKLVGLKDKTVVEAEQKKQQEEMTKMMAEKAKAQVAIDDQLIQDYLKEKGITNAKKTASGLYYVVHQQGSGPNAAAGQKVTVNYTGQNLKGEKFDSNVDPAFNHVQPFEFDLGKRGVIAGWDEGFALFNKGTKATLYIPSGLAYGPNARAAAIPANSVLIFDIELVDFK